MDVVKGDMELIGVGEEGEMEAGDWLWPSPKEGNRAEEEEEEEDLSCFRGKHWGQKYFTV